MELWKPEHISATGTSWHKLAWVCWTLGAVFEMWQTSENISRSPGPLCVVCKLKDLCPSSFAELCYAICFCEMHIWQLSLIRFCSLLPKRRQTMLWCGKARLNSLFLSIDACVYTMLTGIAYMPRTSQNNVQLAPQSVTGLRVMDGKKVLTTRQTLPFHDDRQGNKQCKLPKASKYILFCYLRWIYLQEILLK